ncbi:MAG TPA: AbrB/MazE/SpoVT family DNA-binding domain-containing protein, partial [Chloroflexota bacterium]
SRCILQVAVYTESAGREAGMVVGKVRKVGNSLVVTVPKEEAEELDIREGDLVTVDIRKADVRPSLRPDLQKLAQESWERNKAAYRHLRDH